MAESPSTTRMSGQVPQAPTRVVRETVDHLDGHDGRLRQAAQELRGRAPIGARLQHQVEGDQLEHLADGGLSTLLAVQGAVPPRQLGPHQVDAGADPGRHGAHRTA